MNGSESEIPDRIGRYELSELIAHGRSRDVYSATSHGLAGFRRTVVVKLLRPDTAANPALLQRYLRQVRQLFALSHANIVQAQDLGEDRGYYYLIEEYVDGYDLGTLREMAHAGRLKLSGPLGLHIMSEVIKGIDFGHRKRDPATREPLNLCHGDLHPRNVLIGIEGQVKVSDFGLGGPLSELPDLDRDQAMLRAYAYTAPEVARGGTATQRSDIFTLGLMTVEACAGQHPYGAETADAVKQNAQQGLVSSELIQAVPEPLRPAIEAALQFEPNDRRVDLGQLYDRIMSYLHQEFDHVEASAVADFVQDVQDVDLRTAVVDAGIIATEGGVRGTGASPTLGHTETPDFAELWATTPSLELFWNDPGRATRQLDVTSENRPLEENGRGEELDRIRRELVALVTEPGCAAVFVSGARGQGKSHLLHTAHRKLLAEGFRSVLITPDIDASGRPYSLILDVLSLATTNSPLMWSEQPGQALKTALEEADVADTAGRELIAGLVELVPPAHDLLRVRQALGRALSDLVEGRMGHIPMAIFVDGPERADILSLELIHAMLSTQRPGPLLFVIASLNKALLNQLSRATPTNRRISMLLQQLSPPALMELARRVAASEQVDPAVVAVSAGSPEWVIESALAWRFDEFDGKRPDQVGRLLAQLGPLSVRILGVVTLAETALPTETIARCLVADSAEVRRQCRKLSAIHLLVRRPHGGWLVGPRSVQVAARRLVVEEHDRVRTRLAHLILAHHQGEHAVSRPTATRLFAEAGLLERGLELGTTHAQSLITLGFNDVALSYLDRLAALAEQRGSGVPAQALEIRLQQVQLAMSSMRLDRGHQILAYLPSRAQEIRTDSGLTKALALEARLAIKRGQVSTADSTLRRLAGLVGTGASVEEQAYVSLAMAELWEVQGKLALAQHALERAHHLMTEQPNRSLMHEELSLRLGQVLVRRDERHRAAVLVGSSRPGLEPSRRVAQLYWEGYAALLDGDFGRAASQLEDAYETAHRLGRSAACLTIGPARVEAMIGLGDHAAARKLLNHLQSLTQRLNDKVTTDRLTLFDLLVDGTADNQTGSANVVALKSEMERARDAGDLSRALDASWLRWRLAFIWQTDMVAAVDDARNLASLVGDLGKTRALMG